MLAAVAKKRKLDQGGVKAKGEVRTPSDRSYCCHFPLHLIFV
jgi:hypothetical protein